MPICQSDLTFIVAPPGSGKTSLLFNIMKNAEESNRILYFTLEEDEVDIKRRCDALDISNIKNIDFYGIDQGVVTIKTIKEEISSGNYDLICIDQFNKIKPQEGEKRTDFREYFTNSVLELRELTKKYKVPIIVVHQLNRGWEEVDWPSFSLIKETSAIEEEATRVICFWSHNNPPIS